MNQSYIYEPDLPLNVLLYSLYLTKLYTDISFSPEDEGCNLNEIFYELWYYHLAEEFYCFYFWILKLTMV